MNIVFAKTHEEAVALQIQGFVPIECSFGSHGSVVDPLYVMDHHGNLSHLEGVALRAYRDHFGAMRQSFKDGTAKFVVTGAADADACFSIAALIGELPHPSLADEYKDAPPHILASKIRDMSAFAALVNRMDVDPIGVQLEETPDGDLLLLWNQMASSSFDAIAFYAGVDRWRALFARPSKALLAATKAEKAEQTAKAREATVVPITPSVAFVESEVWGFDVWYAEFAPCIVSRTPHGNITIGCRDMATAERLFGKGGLKNIFPKLQPEGWGGRETIGGCPRGMTFTTEETLAVAQHIASFTEVA